MTFYKKMRSLEASNVERLHKVFPRLADCLNNWEEFENEGSASFAISVFDHWLNFDEAEQLIPNFYGSVHESRNQRRFENLRPLVDGAYLVELDEAGSAIFSEFQSRAEKDRLVTDDVYKEELISFVIPDRSIFVSIGHDYTDYIYYDPEFTDPSYIRTGSIAIGLFCLNNERTK